MKLIAIAAVLAAVLGFGAATDRLVHPSREAGAVSVADGSSTPPADGDSGWGG